MVSSSASPASILGLRKSINAATAAQSAEEREGRHFWRKYRLQAYKMWFFALTLVMQTGDAISDIVTEGTYFFFSNKGGNMTRGSNITTEDGPELGDVFDVCYALHGILSVAVSGMIMWRVATVFAHMRKARRERKLQQSGSVQHFAADEKSFGGRATPAMHRAAAQLQRDDKEGGNSTASHQQQQQATSGGDGVSVASLMITHASSSKGDYSFRVA